MNIQAVVAVLILLAAIYSFVKEKISPDLTALLVFSFFCKKYH